MSKVTFRIDLVYNQEDFEFATDQKFDTEASFIEAAGEYAIEDLVALWREYSNAKDFSEVIMGEENE